MARIGILPLALPLVILGLELAASPSVAARRQDVHEVQVVARRFTFEPATIQVIAGERVRLVVRSADTTHGFAIRGLKLDVDIPRGGDAVIEEFIAPPPGRYDIKCSELCGSGHGQMKAALVSVPEPQ
ncbi:MAG TPA: cupredoxin domain-containing protein [Vicinamibacterales bacterium]|nr:cupredoxin domain-containing protein [Vicinamibacterales bacterium]